MYDVRFQIRQLPSGSWSDVPGGVYVGNQTTASSDLACPVPTDYLRLHQDATGLQAGTRYEYRLATNTEDNGGGTVMCDDSTTPGQHDPGCDDSSAVYDQFTTTTCAPTICARTSPPAVNGFQDTPASGSDFVGPNVRLGGVVETRVEAGPSDGIRYRFRYRLPAGGDAGQSIETAEQGPIVGASGPVTVQSERLPITNPWTTYQYEIGTCIADLSTGQCNTAYTYRGRDTDDDGNGEASTPQVFQTAADPTGHHGTRTPRATFYHWGRDASTPEAHIDLGDCAVSGSSLWGTGWAKRAQWDISGTITVRNTTCDAATQETRVGGISLGANGPLGLTTRTLYSDDHLRPHGQVVGMTTTVNKIELNDDIGGNFSQAIRDNVVLHELGHALSLTHREGTVMNTVASGSFPNVTQIDLDAVAFVHGHTDSDTTSGDVAQPAGGGGGSASAAAPAPFKPREIPNKGDRVSRREGLTVYTYVNAGSDARGRDAFYEVIAEYRSVAHLRAGERNRDRYLGRALEP